jgi:hypothetical protein
MTFHSFSLFSTANIMAIQYIYTYTQPKTHSYDLSMEYFLSPKYGTP